MLNEIFVILFIIIFILSYWYIFKKLKKDQLFINNIIKSENLIEIIPSYTGYVICSDDDMIKDEINLFRDILSFVERKENCLLVDLNKKAFNDQLDLKCMEKLRINSIPAILYIAEDGGISEVINFESFPPFFTNDQILKKIKCVIEQD
ncbi:MAG: hypothetical protein ACQEXK_20390 [Bacillota bacterium]